MKKQPYWKAVRGENKTIKFEEAQGYVIDVTNDKGYTVKVAIDYTRPYWQATHYDSGLLCSLFKWDCKSKDALISELKKVDFEKYIKGNQFVEDLKQQLADFRSKNYGG